MLLLHDRASVGPASPAEPDALIREARRLRRRRWTVGIVAALVAAGIVVAVTGGGGNHAAEPYAGSGDARTSGLRNGRSGVAVAANAPAVLYSGLMSPTEGWVSNGGGVFLTTNSGGAWKAIRPKNLVGLDSAQVTEVDATDATHFWIALSDAELPRAEWSANSTRGDVIDSTVDAGRSWRESFLPDCVHECGIAGVSFLNDQTGFAVATKLNGSGPSNTVRTYATANGGLGWKLIGSSPAATGETDSTLQFTTPRDGWLASSGGLLETTDGGVHWNEVTWPTLPTDNQLVEISRLRFFTGQDGALALTVEDTSTGRDHDVIETTSDGGDSWSAAVAPASIPGASINTNRTLTASFASMSTWYLQAGDRLYVTRSAGHSWMSSVPSAPWSHGAFQLTGIDFITPNTGWAQLEYNSCGGLPRNATGYTKCSNHLGLAITRSGGRDWTLISSTSLGQLPVLRVTHG